MLSDHALNAFSNSRGWWMAFCKIFAKFHGQICYWSIDFFFKPKKASGLQTKWQSHHLAKSQIHHLSPRANSDITAGKFGC